jgi:hypothetical protein
MFLGRQLLDEGIAGRNFFAKILVGENGFILR